MKKEREKEITMGILNRITDIMVKEDRSRHWVAQRIGICPSTMQGYYERESCPPVHVLVEICELFDIDLMWLVYGGNKE